MTTFTLTQTNGISANELNGGDQVVGRTGTVYSIVSVGKNGIWVTINDAQKKTRMPLWAFEARE